MTDCKGVDMSESNEELVAEARALAGPFLAGGPGKPIESLLTRLANALEALQPRTVTTREELDALPSGAVVLETGEHPSAYQSEGWGGWSGDGRWYDSGQIPLPATVLYAPSDSGSPHVSS